jgi:hypothetical protein
MVYEFALERSKDAFDTGEVLASAGAVHAGADAVLTERTGSSWQLLTVAIGLCRNPVYISGAYGCRYKSTIYEGLPGALPGGRGSLLRMKKSVSHLEQYLGVTTSI